MRLTSQARTDFLNRLNDAKERIQDGLLTDGELRLLAICKDYETPEDIRACSMRAVNWLTTLQSKAHAIREIEKYFQNSLDKFI